MITTKEIVRRAIQYIAGTIIFDLPVLIRIRMSLYRMFFSIGERCLIAHDVQFILPHDYRQGTLRIGEQVEIGPHVTIDYAGGVTIHNHAWISDAVMIFTHDHSVNSRRLKKDQPKKTSPLVIGEDSWIGSRSIILPGVERIGSGAIVGAGSVVSKNVGDFLIVAGNPAQVIGQRFEC